MKTHNQVYFLQNLSKIYYRGIKEEELSENEEQEENVEEENLEDFRENTSTPGIEIRYETVLNEWNTFQILHRTKSLTDYNKSDKFTIFSKESK